MCTVESDTVPSPDTTKVTSLLMLDGKALYWPSAVRRSSSEGVDLDAHQITDDVAGVVLYRAFGRQPREPGVVDFGLHEADLDGHAGDGFAPAETHGGEHDDGHDDHQNDDVDDIDLAEDPAPVIENTSQNAIL